MTQPYALVLVNPSVTAGCLVLSAVLAGSLSPSVLAHGGGLDSQGCHTNRKTGDRHCYRSGGSAPKPSAGLGSGPVTLVSVGDSDTVRVTSRQGERVTIRLACIDAPETAQGSSDKWSKSVLPTPIANT